MIAHRAVDSRLGDSDDECEMLAAERFHEDRAFVRMRRGSVRLDSWLVGDPGYGRWNDGEC